MNRVTRKFEDGYILPVDEYGVEGYLKAIEKLGKLEDLEEKYDLPLDVLVTLLDHYYYYDEDKHQKIIHSLDMYHKQIVIKKYENDDDIYGYYEHLNFKDHKKTWWVKEDLSE